jgi:hypothetical protein
MTAHIDAPQHGCALRVVDTTLELVGRQFTELCSDLGGPFGAAAGAGWCGGRRSRAPFSRRTARAAVPPRGRGVGSSGTIGASAPTIGLRSISSSRSIHFEEVLQGAVLH